MKRDEITRHFKEITFTENNARLRLLTEFRGLVLEYFENNSFTLTCGSCIEDEKARETGDAINRLKKKAYRIIRLAGINPRAASSPALSAWGHGKNIDFILNIFNLGRNGIPLQFAIDSIERARDVYKSNRVDSLVRTINPFFWMAVIGNYLSRELRKARV